MERQVMHQLVAWKNAPDRKPLILKGARQVGKTWLMKAFGAQYYKSVVYVNFDEDPEMRSIFESNKDPNRIVMLISLLTGVSIDAANTLIVLDEIQECPEALNSLKYFCEKAPQYHVMAAGSLLGTLLAQPKSYPVGKVNILTLGPMMFDEFLLASDPMLYQYYDSIIRNQPVEAIFHNRLLEAYHIYLIVGGMPECVHIWANTRDSLNVAKHQRELIEIYENDFSKHNGRVNSGRLLMVFRSIVSQLAKENEKFIYGAVRTGGRARDFEEAIEWLVSAGMLNRVYNVSKPVHPLPAYERLDCFKLYMFDTGLLKWMAGIDNRAILLRSDFSFKGPLAENYCLQQIKSQFDVAPHYYAIKNTELDFLIQNGQKIIPIEVKAGESRVAASFKRFIAEHNSEIAVRFSELGYETNPQFINMPLYLVPRLSKFIPMDD